MPSTRRYGPSGTSSVTGSTPTVNVSLTAPFVLFSSKRNVPANVTEGTFTATVALTVPAMHAGVMRKKPVPFVTLTMLVVPLPSESVRLAAPTRITKTSSKVPSERSAPALFDCSNAKSPLKVWPSTLKRTSVPSTRTYGPAGRFSETVVLPTFNCSTTAERVLLIARLNRPENVAPPAMLPICTFPETRPASPAAVMTSAPSPSVNETISVAPARRCSSTPVATRRITFPPVAMEVICSSAKLPERIWPPTVSVAGVAGSSSVAPGISLIESRTNGPAGRSSVTVSEPTAMTEFTGAPMVLMATPSVPAKVTPGMFVATTPDNSPARPALV